MKLGLCNRGMAVHAKQPLEYVARELAGPARSPVILQRSRGHAPHSRWQDRTPRPHSCSFAPRTRLCVMVSSASRADSGWVTATFPQATPTASRSA